MNRTPRLVFLILLSSVVLNAYSQIGNEKKKITAEEIEKLADFEKQIKIDTASLRKITLPEFGEVDKSHMEMEVYEKDTFADALVLIENGDLGYSTEKDKFYLKYHKQIKIFNDKGFEYANVSVPFRGKSGIHDVKAITHNLKDGKVISRVLEEDKMLVEDVMDDYKVMSIPFSDVVEGSVIEYSYTVYEDSPLAFLPWYFQSRIPVLCSRLKLLFPRSYNLKPRLYGYYAVHSYDRTSYGRHEIAMIDIPAFIEEPYVKNIDDHYAKVVFEYIDSYADSWEDLVGVIMDMKGFGETLKKTSNVRKIYPSDKGWSTNELSLKEIHSYVSDHFTWNGDYALMFSDKPKKVWEEGQGTSADINLSLLMFLRKAGFEADPVFLSTAERGLINPDFPTFRQFNNVVVRVQLNEQAILVDATEKLRPFNALPVNCLNGKGMVIKAGEPEWVSTNLNDELSIQSMVINYGVSEEGVVSGSGSIQTPGPAGADIKAVLIEEDSTELEKRLEQSLHQLELENVIYSGIDDAYSTLKQTFDFDGEGFAEVLNDQIFLAPVIVKEFENNPFNSEKRTLFIDFPMKISKKYLFTIRIPEGYEIEETPEDVSYSLPGRSGTYLYLSQVTENKVTISIRFTINKLMFYPEEYSNIREMFNLILEKQEERLVFKKKN